MTLDILWELPHRNITILYFDWRDLSLLLSLNWKLKEDFQVLIIDCFLMIWIWIYLNNWLNLKTKWWTYKYLALKYLLSDIWNIDFHHLFGHTNLIIFYFIHYYYVKVCKQQFTKLPHHHFTNFPLFILTSPFSFNHSKCEKLK